MGGKDKAGTYNVAKDWYLKYGVGFPFKSMEQDPDIIASQKKTGYDLDILRHQLATAQIRENISTTWYAEWDRFTQQQIQNVLLRQIKPARRDGGIGEKGAGTEEERVSRHVRSRAEGNANPRSSSFTGSVNRRRTGRRRCERVAEHGVRATRRRPARIRRFGGRGRAVHDGGSRRCAGGAARCLGGRCDAIVLVRRLDGRRRRAALHAAASARVQRLLLVATGGFTPNVPLALEKADALSCRAMERGHGRPGGRRLLPQAARPPTRSPSTGRSRCPHRRRPRSRQRARTRPTGRSTPRDRFACRR